MEPWVHKYRPASLGHIHGQDAAVAAIRSFLKNFKRQKKKGLLLYGPAGCGKTSAVVAAARELDLEMIEFNASDVRNKAAIETVVKNSLGQQSLFFKQKVILLDELDGVSGTKDRGGVAALVPLIKDSAFPILMTANDGLSDKLKPLKRDVQLVECAALSHDHVLTVLKNICEKEGVEYDEHALRKLARHADGDLRGAINDLETLCSLNKRLEEDNVLELSRRDKKEKMQDALIKVFKNSDLNIALGAFDHVDEDLGKVMLWLDENLPYEYSFEGLARAYDYLSKADVFNGRIRRWQYWRFLVYIRSLCSAGIAAAKDERYKPPIEYKRNKRILTMWIMNNANAKRKAIAAKWAEHTHCSTRRAVKDFGLIRTLLKNSPKIQKTLDLSSDESAWLAQ